MSVFDHFDDKLNNILKIKENNYDEACILIYVYIDYLVQFSKRMYNDNNHHKENFRHFIINYSGMSDILKYIQIDRLINHFEASEEKRRKYGHYLEPYREKFELVKKGGELGMTDFFNIDDVEEKDRKFFSKYTIANRIYEFRNFAVHEYHNKIYEALDSNEPILVYFTYDNENQNSRFSVLYPFEFLFEILYNCYINIRTNYEETIKKNYNYLLEDDSQ